MNFLASSTPRNREMFAKIWAIKKGSNFTVPATVITKGCRIEGNKIKDHVSVTRGTSLSKELKKVFCEKAAMPVEEIKCRTVIQVDGFKFIFECSEHPASTFNATIFHKEISLDGENKAYLWSSEHSILCDCLKKNNWIKTLLLFMDVREVKKQKPTLVSIPMRQQTAPNIPTRGSDDQNQTDDSQLREMVTGHHKQLKDYDKGFDFLINAILTNDLLPQQEKQKIFEFSQNRRRMSSNVLNNNTNHQTFGGAGCSHWRMPQPENDEHDESDESSNDETEENSNSQREAGGSDYSDVASDTDRQEVRIQELRGLVRELKAKLKKKQELKPFKRNLTSKIRELKDNLTLKELIIEEKEATINDLEESITAKDEEIGAKDFLIGQKNLKLQQKEAELAEKAAEVEKLKKRVEMVEKFIADYAAQK